MTSYGLKRGDFSESSLNSDTDSVAPQSSVYSADLKGSQMTINSEFSVNSSVSSTPIHQGLSNPTAQSRFMKSQPSKPSGATEVGLKELTNQIRRKFVRNGFRLNLMVVGETGLGKSTFVNTLFHSTVYDAASDLGDSSSREASQSCVVSSSSDRWKNEVSKFQKSENAAATGKQHKTSLSSRPTSLATALKINTSTSNTTGGPTSGTSESSPATCKLPQWAVEETQCRMNEGNVSLLLGLLDTPGFAQCLNNTDCAEPLVNYINKQFDKFMTIESQVDRCDKENKKSSSSVGQSNSSKKGLSTKLSNDPRVHCCLYFLSPQSPHRLKAVDVQTMKSLGDKVNLIPLIAKADTLTAEELKHFKQMVNQQVAANDIKVFEIPELTPEQQQNFPEMNKENKKLKGMTPFAVCGSSSVNSAGVRVREYPFGQVEIENPLHCDFVALRTVLMEMHTWNLIESTEHNHYEKYRSLKLASSIGSTSAASTPTPAGGNTMASSLGIKANGAVSGKESFYSKTSTGSSSSGNKNPLAILGEERKAHEERLTKMQADMQSVFEQKVAEKERRLKMKEEEMMKKHEEMRRNLEAQQAALAAAREQHERNLQAWTESTAAVSTNHNTATLPAGYGGGDVHDSAMATSKDKKKKLFGR